MKTPFRWAGSKKALLPTLRRYWQPTFNRYIEPFCGSACLFFDLEPKKAILNDINSELIATYRAIKTNPREVIACLKHLTPTKENYYTLREIDPFTLAAPALAARFIFLNRLAFNGIYRTNKCGKFNVPYAEPKERVRFEFDALGQLSTPLKRAQLRNEDFESVLNDVRRGDFVYLDPPYIVAKRRVFAEYNAKTFSASDISRLSDALLSVDKRGAYFVVSYADSPEGRRLVEGWNWRRVRTRRNVAGFASNRRTAYEVMATNLELAA